MKNMKRLGVILSIFVVIAIAVFATGVARAANSRAELAADQTVNGLYVRAAENISLRGTVNGDVIVAGSTVEIEGTINGSVYAVAERVIVRGVVTGNVHAAGSEVEVAASDAGSVFVAAADVKFGDDLRVQNLFAAGSDVRTRGEVVQNMYVGGSTVLVDSKVGGDVALAGETITIAGGATIGGNLTYTSQSEATIENDRSIAGSIKRTEPAKEATPAERIVAQLSDMAYWLAANIFIAAIALLMMPKVFLPAEDYFVKKPLNNYFKALAFVVFVPILLILLLFTIIGIPLVFIGGLIYLLVLVLAPTASAHFVGGYVLNQMAAKKANTRPRNYMTELGAAALGFFLLAVVGLVPVFGGFLTIAAFFLGVGILLSRNLMPLGYGSIAKTKK